MCISWRVHCASQRLRGRRVQLLALRREREIRLDACVSHLEAPLAVPDLLLLLRRAFGRRGNGAVSCNRGIFIVWRSTKKSAIRTLPEVYNYTGPRLSACTILLSVDVRWFSSCLINACIAAHCCACCSCCCCCTWTLTVSFTFTLDCGGVPAKPFEEEDLGG